MLRERVSTVVGVGTFEHERDVTILGKRAEDGVEGGHYFGEIVQQGSASGRGLNTAPPRLLEA